MEPGGGRCDPRPLTRDEEAVKRNTDCVYFLASPLTCKKGSECEYRHSEAVRVNPRDCKFWFSGNCLNPKCLFRHPPFDGPVGNPVAASGSVMAASQVNASMLLSMGNSSAYNSSRNNVPCYYFQKGTCLKGDKCPFMHGPQHTATSVLNQTAKVSAPVATQPKTTKKEAWKLKEWSNNQNSSMAGKPVNGASSLPEGSLTLENPNVHLVHKSSSASFSRPHLNEREAGENLGEFSGVGYSKLKRPLNQQPQSSQYRNEKGVEEAFREFSPGFDILVDNGHHHRDSESWDQRNGAGEFLHYGKAQNDVDGSQHRVSSVSERILDEHISPVRRSAHRRRIPDGVDETDLRHRLMKQRRLNSSLSATISDPESKAYGRHELKMQNRRRHNTYGDQRRLLTESSGGGRLRDRITVSKPLSQEFPSDLHGGGRGRQRGDLSPMRPPNLQRRLGERLSRRLAEDSSGNARNIGNQQKSRDSVDPLDFAGPRSLAELKESSRVQSNKNILSSMEHRGTKPLKAGGLRDSEISVVFDGPKPLSTLLNRKAEARSENDAISVVSSDRKGIREIDVGSSPFEAEVFISNPEEPEIGTAVEEEGEIEEEVVHIPADQVAEDETEARDAAEDEELDYADQLDGEYDYETVDGGDYKTEDDENMDPMNIDDDEEDEDDFAKNIGLIFS